MAGVSLVTLLPFYRYPLKERDWTQKRGPKHGDSFRGPSSTSRHRENVRAVAVDLRRVTEQQQAKSSSLWAKLCVSQNLPPPAHAYSSNLVLAGEVKTQEKASLQDWRHELNVNLNHCLLLCSQIYQIRQDPLLDPSFARSLHVASAPVQVLHALFCSIIMWSSKED